MALTNTLAPKKEENTKLTFSTFCSNKKKSIEEMLGKDGATRFISAIVSAVATTPALADCSHASLLSGALLGESLKLAHSPQLGQYYLVPFKDRKSNTTQAQFILGVKGWKQLAIRSGQYRLINAIPVKEGEYLGLDPLTAEPKIRFITDPDKRDKLPVVGYYAYFELLNGYRRGLYWTKNHALEHADRYSQAFSWHGVNTDKMQKVSYEDYLLGKYPKQDEWKYSSFWYKDFDTMACGKVVKALLSGGDAPLSIEMQQAINADENVIEMSEDEEFHFGTADKADNVSPDIPENIDEDGVVSDTTDETAENEQAPTEEPKKATRAKRTAQTTEESQEEMSDMFFGNKKK